MKPISPKTIILIVGPTAVGKTAVAIETAKHFKTEIISADSRQCYKELNIGVARPSPEELQSVPHHFIESHSILGEVNAAGFEKFALETAEKIFRFHPVCIMTGGTGLYIRTFCEGLDEMPEMSPDIREMVRTNYHARGLEWLQKEVQRSDPEFFGTGEIKNPQRLMRALEIIRATGLPVSSFRKGKKIVRPFNIIKIGLSLSKEELHQNINQRVDKMMREGLLEEVKRLYPFRNLNALKTVGYTELFDFLDHEISIEKAVELIKRRTRQYAKRQMTWFRKDKDIKWFSPNDLKEMLKYLTHNASIVS